MPKQINNRKLCTKCKKVKSLGAFARDAASADGLRYQCKKCYNEYQMTEVVKERHRKQYLDNKQFFLDKAKKWANENSVRRREISRFAERKRRSSKIGNGFHTQEEWQQLCDIYGNICLCCGSFEKLLTVDHIIPLSKGGTDYIDNIQPLCMNCNAKKHTKIIDYRRNYAQQERRTAYGPR